MVVVKGSCEGVTFEDCCQVNYAAYSVRILVLSGGLGGSSNGGGVRLMSGDSSSSSGGVLGIGSGDSGATGVSGDVSLMSGVDGTLVSLLRRPG